MVSKKDPACRQAGYTLIELIIVITIVSVFSFSFAVFIAKATDAWLFVKSRESAFGSARYSLNRTLTELRRAGGASQILVASPSECQFVDISGNTIDFKQAGSSLYRNNDVLASDLVSPSGLVFTYLNSTAVSTTDVLSIRAIRVKISIVKNAQTVILESSARIRN
ncbi:prepilin-type N-terminal cleavage/methylation domain-containing protein [Candidatus Saganbacteria bacterium]|nr:prepilin-type N-terminal cleavage/methylation domain-containing protein [Candidatus Saganbacteria bacterium]